MIYLIIWLLIGFAAFVYVSRDQEWVRWILHSVFYRWHVRTFKRNLKYLSYTQRTLALVEWLDADFWFKKFWFGRQFEKIVIKELEKLRN